MAHLYQLLVICSTFSVVRLNNNDRNNTKTVTGNNKLCCYSLMSLFSCLFLTCVPHWYTLHTTENCELLSSVVYFREDVANDTKQCWQEIFRSFPMLIDLICEQMGKVDFNYSIAESVVLSRTF